MASDARTTSDPPAPAPPPPLCDEKEEEQFFSRDTVAAMNRPSTREEREEEAGATRWLSGAGPRPPWDLAPLPADPASPAERALADAGRLPLHVAQLALEYALPRLEAAALFDRDAPDARPRAAALYREALLDAEASDGEQGAAALRLAAFAALGLRSRPRTDAAAPRPSAAQSRHAAARYALVAASAGVPAAAFVLAAPLHVSLLGDLADGAALAQPPPPPPLSLPRCDDALCRSRGAPCDGAAERVVQSEIDACGGLPGEDGRPNSLLAVDARSRALLGLWAAGPAASHPAALAAARRAAANRDVYAQLALAELLGAATLTAAGESGGGAEPAGRQAAAGRMEGWRWLQAAALAGALPAQRRLARSALERVVGSAPSGLERRAGAEGYATRARMEGYATRAGKAARPFILPEAHAIRESCEKEAFYWLRCLAEQGCDVAPAARQLFAHAASRSNDAHARAALGLARK